MSSYRQLSIEERCEIARLRAAGQSFRQIAAALDRQPSTIGRELHRNSGTQIGYRPAHAQKLTQARRWTGSRLERDTGLRTIVLDRLSQGWSPEQIAGRLAYEAGGKVISHETIYRFVYAQLKRTNDRRWRFYLPRAKYKRGWRTKGGWPRQKGRCSIHERPPLIATRKQPGHWEADTILFSNPGQAIMILHERQTRLTMALRHDSLKAEPVATALIGMLDTLPSGLRRSITFDNGAEFSRHHRVASQLGLNTFFCDPHAPWQKGGVENAIGRLRKNLPRRTNLDSVPNAQLDAILANYNNTPRKCLSFLTPAEAFIPLHFKCESTPGSRPG